jgi:hypothetical protein
MITYFGYNYRIIDEIPWFTTYPPIILLAILMACVIVNGVLMLLHRFYNVEKRQKAKKDEYFESMENTMDVELRKKYDEWG